MNLRSKNGQLRNDDVIIEYLFQVMDEHLPLMEPIYNQYCSNFPLATKYYAEMTKIPYRSTTLTPSGTLRRGDSATLRAPSTLNREIATSSMSLRASVRHSKLFDSPLRLRNVLSPKKNIFDSSKTEKPTANQKERKSAIPKKIRRRHSAHYRDADCENSDSSSLSESSSDEKSLSPPTIAPPSGGNKYNSLKIKRRVKKSLSAPNCTSGHPECISGCSIDSPALKIDFINACLQRSKSLNTGLPLPAHLLEPVQRVMRYTILLKTLRNHLADEIDKAQSDPPQTDQSDRSSKSDESEDSFDGSLSSLHSYCPSSLKYVDLAIERSKKLAHSTNYYQPTHNLQPTQKPPPPTQPTRRLNRNSLSISYTTATLLRQKVNSKSETADLAEEKKSRRRSFERFKNAAENFLRGR